MILMNYGGKIKGDSAYPDHKDWIQLSSCQFGVGRGIASSSGGSDRETGTPSVSEVVVTKNSDVSSVDLFVESAGGKDPKLTTIDFCNVQGNKVNVYLQLELENTLISGYSVSSGGDRPTESLSLNFTKIKYKYTKFESGGGETPIGPKGWDLTTHQQI
jgi:type VI secretion system secreted protein Hcp